MKHSIILLCSMLFMSLFNLSSCSKDEPAAVDCTTKGSLSLKINGTEWVAKSFNNTMVASASAGTDGKRLDLRATNADGETLDISISDLTSGTVGDCISPTATYTSFDDVSTGEENVFFFTLMNSSNTTLAQAVAGTLDITNCDEANKSISGTFTFSGAYDNSDDFIGINGTFSNVCYSVLR